MLQHENLRLFMAVATLCCFGYKRWSSNQFVAPVMADDRVSPQALSSRQHIPFKIYGFLTIQRNGVFLFFNHGLVT